MIKCRRCDVMILEDTKVCPLCRCAVEETSDAEKTTVRINEYPEVRIRQRKITQVSKLLLVILLTLSAVLVIIDLAVPSSSWWCLIPIAAMTSLYAAFRMIFVSRRGYRWKVFMPMIVALILLIIIDAETGFYGWSLSYVLPSIILIADFIILMLMVTNLRNWQSYMIMQIAAIASCLIPAALWITGIIESPLMVMIAAGVSVLMFAGTLIIGGNTAKRELKRRFHIR